MLSPLCFVYRTASSSSTSRWAKSKVLKFLRLFCSCDRKGSVFLDWKGIQSVWKSQGLYICIYFCMNCYVPFFLFLPSPLYLSLLIQQSLLMLLPPPLLFLLPSSANAVSFAANTATDVNSSSSFALSLLLLRLLLWFSDIACLVSSIASATTTTSVSASASSATPAQFLPPPLILYL